jgi:hypothetical protein
MSTFDRIRALFRGADDAYGSFVIDPHAINDGGKVAGDVKTHRGPVTEELWKDHFEGKKGLGIIPIGENNECRWGCIDVDRYPAPVEEILNKLITTKLPLNPCYSKSGGIHLFLFVSSPVSAKTMQSALRLMSIQLGLGGCEIFPKQIVRDTAKGEIGNWLNMPFFGNSRLGVGPKGKSLTATAFVEHVIVIEPDELSKIKVKVDEKTFPDGPPCIQAICGGNISENRNNTLMAITTYLRLADPDNMNNRLYTFNEIRVKPPLSHDEVTGILKRNKANNYNYQCQQEPIKSYCNRPLCLTRKFGIQSAKGGAMIVDSVTFFNGEPEIWVIRMNGAGILQLTTEQLMDQRQFRLRYLATFFNLPPRMKSLDWDDWIRDTTQQATRVETEELSKDAQFRALFDEFVERKCKPDKIIIMRGGAYEDESGAIWLRMTALTSFLKERKFSYFTSGHIGRILKDLHAEYKLIRINATTVVKAYRIPYSRNHAELPPNEGELI